MFRKIFLLFSPDDAPGATSDSGDFDADMAVLNDVTEEPAPKPGQKAAKAPVTEEIPVDEDDGGGEGEDEELSETPEEGAETEDEEGETETEEEPEEEEQRIGRTSIGDVKKEFPGIFKKFPELKASFFRDAEFSKILGSPEEAQIASQKAENYDLLESSLVQGNPQLLMKELSQNNPRAFKDVITNWLPQLQAIDNKLYIQATEPVIEELIYLAFKHAEKVGDKNLAMSARHLANFVFANGGDIPDLTAKHRKEPNPAEEELQNERRAWAETRYKEADGEVFNRVIRSLDQTIRQGLDPSGTMTERMKASIVKDVINEINQLLVKDPVHGRRMSGLWKRASTDSYSRQSKESIVSTYLSGARPLVRELRNRIRAEYLSSPSKKRGEKDEKLVEQPVRKRPFEGSSKRVDQRRERAVVLDPRKIDYSRTSDMDILSDKVTLRK
jgi:hypothetical protein